MQEALKAVHEKLITQSIQTDCKTGQRMTIMLYYERLKNMAKKNNFLEKLDLQIDEEKISIIEFYLRENKETIDISAEISALINSYIDKLYIKKVPRSVRHFIDNKDKEVKRNENERNGSEDKGTAGNIELPDAQSVLDNGRGG